jgi:light-regulated signal transduction histidine kinase (bacteriophytochrome)
MGRLIDDLLRFSRTNRQSLIVANVAMASLVRECQQELKRDLAGRRVDVVIGDLPDCCGDSALIKQVWLNFLSNALKFTRQREVARIEVGSLSQDGETVYYVRDNGVGFDMEYANKLFGVFQRLHAAEDYEGTGIGLALAQRILHRHKGRAWAEGKLNQGATFYFVLGKDNCHAQQ